MGQTETHVSTLNSRQLKAAIDRTRAEMDETVDRLSEQLGIRHLLDRLLAAYGSDGAGPLRAQVKSVAKRAGMGLLHLVERHPLPSAMIGTGLAWMVLGEPRTVTRTAEGEGRLDGLGSGGFQTPGSPVLADEMPALTEQPTSGGYFQERAYTMNEQENCEFSGTGSTAESIASAGSGRIKEATSKIKDAAGKAGDWSKQKLEQIKDQSGMVGEKVKAGTAQMGDRVRNRLDRVRAQVDVGRRRAVDVVEEYPLMIGVCALAVGVVVGLSIPTGRKERRLIGQRASQLTGRVRDTARDIFERGKEVAETTFESVKDEARRQGLTGSCIKDTALESMDDLTERLEAVAETGKETLKDELHGETQRIERDLGVSKTDRNEGGSI